MLPSSLLSAREYMMKRCWRSWPHMTWKLSPHSSLWPTSVPGLPRAMHGTRHHRPELPRWVARVPSLGTAKRRRTAASRGHRLLLRSSQPRLGAVASATSAHGRRGVTAAHALYTPTVATAPRSVARSSSSRSASASGTSRLPRMAPTSSPAWQGKGRRQRGGCGRMGPRVSVARGGPKGCFHRRLRLR
jgi:hypothetical protein